MGIADELGEGGAGGGQPNAAVESPLVSFSPSLD